MDTLRRLSPPADAPGVPLMMARLMHRVGPVIAIVAGLVALKWPWGYDLEAYLQAAKTVAAGGDPYAATLSAGLDEWGRSQVYVSPPFVAQVLAPFSSLPFPVVFAGWTIASLLVLVAAVRLIDRETLAAKAPLVLFATVYVWGSIVLGQVNVFALAGLLLALGSRNSAAAGLGLALAILTRAVPGAFAVVLVLERRWRALAWATGAVLLAIATSPQDWINYITVVREAASLPTLTLAAVQTSLAPWPVLHLLAAAAVVVVVVVAALIERDRVLMAGLAIGVALVLLPTNAWHHWLSFALAPLFLFGDTGPWTRRLLLGYIALSFLDYGILSTAVSVIALATMLAISLIRLRGLRVLKRGERAAILRLP